MATYLFKVNGKTIKATNIKTGNVVEIATAPFWIKPYHEHFDWLGNIERYRWNEKNDIFTPTVQSREAELQSIGLWKKYDEAQIRDYWHMKRLVIKAMQQLKDMENRGVEYVVFYSDKEIKELDYEFNVYTLNDCVYSDQPYMCGYFDGSTEEAGTCKCYGKNSVFHPQKEIHAIPLFR